MVDDIHTPIISRAQAQALGLKRYFTGKPCKHGHVVERLVDGGCCECQRLRMLSQQRRRYATQWQNQARARDPQKYRDAVNRSRANNLEAARERDRRNYAAGNGRGREHAAQWRAENPESVRAANKRKYWKDGGAEDRQPVRGTEGAPWMGAASGFFSGRPE